MGSTSFWTREPHHFLHIKDPAAGLPSAHPLGPPWNASWAVIMAPGWGYHPNTCWPSSCLQGPFPSELSWGMGMRLGPPVQACPQLAAFRTPHAPVLSQSQFPSPSASSFIRILALPLIKSSAHLPSPPLSTSPLLVSPAAWRRAAPLGQL